LKIVNGCSQDERRCSRGSRAAKASDMLGCGFKFSRFILRLQSANQGHIRAAVRLSSAGIMGQIIATA
jgi:hypothetical protein